jgi:formate dehydrogenase
VFDEISRRMGLGGSCPDKDIEAEAEARGTRPTPRDVIDALLARGPAEGITFDGLVDSHPNGVALLDTLPEGRLTKNLPTPDGRVQLFSEQLQIEIRNLRGYVEPDDHWPMRLIGRREKGSQNTWMHQSSRIYPDTYEFAAHVHQSDADECGVKDGEDVRLVSSTGSIIVPIIIRDDIRSGVVSVPNGWGHAGGSWSRANAIKGVNSNDLVSPDEVEAIAGMSILNGVPVRMERITRASSEL